MDEEIKRTVKHWFLRDITFYGTLVSLALCTGILPVLQTLPGLRSLSPAVSLCLQVLALTICCLVVFPGAAFLLSEKISFWKMLDLHPVSFRVFWKICYSTLAVYLLLTLLTGGISWLLKRLGIPCPSQPIIALLRTGSVWTRLPVIFSAILLTPWDEELCFRFGILHKIEQFTGPAGSAAISALIFAILHLNLQVFPALFLLGLWLVWLYRQTGSLLAPILSHALFNGLTILLLIFCQ